jgi:hypothetical protein
MSENISLTFGSKKITKSQICIYANKKTETQHFLQDYLIEGELSDTNNFSSRKQLK